MKFKFLGKEKMLELLKKEHQLSDVDVEECRYVLVDEKKERYEMISFSDNRGYYKIAQSEVDDINDYELTSMEILVEVGDDYILVKEYYLYENEEVSTPKMVRYMVVK